jgi:hypothetical protein
VVRIREAPDKTSIETAYYLLSKALSAERFNEVVRQHWGVENRLHWRLDVVMNEDQDRTRLGNDPIIWQFFATWRSTPCSAKPPKAPCAEKRAGWDEIAIDHCVEKVDEVERCFGTPLDFARISPLGHPTERNKV